MRISGKALLLPLLLSVAACQPSGFYDNHGNYHSSDSGYQGQPAVVTNAGDDRNAVAYDFTRPGFYDAQGNYAGDNSVFGVTSDFLPPAGMCRVWTPDKPASIQPPADSCKAKYHLHHNQYLIYGG